MKAILLALLPTTEGAPACLLEVGGQTILSRVTAQLARFGVHDTTVLVRAGWGDACAAASTAPIEEVEGPFDLIERLTSLASAAPEGLVLAEAEQLTHDGAVAALLDDPRVRTGVLVGEAGTAGRPPARVARGRLVAGGSAYHDVANPNASLLGLLRLSGADRERFHEVAERIVASARSLVPAAWAGGRADPGRVDPLPLLVTGMVRDGMAVTPVALREFHWSRPTSQVEAVAAADRLSEVDEDQVLLDSSVKAEDGFFTTFLVSPYSKYIARWAARRGLTPNQVTVVSLLVGVLAAAAFATGSRWGLVAGAVLLQAAFTLDCVDGQLARYTRNFSPVGGWLDSTFDRGKEYLVYAGLAVGGARIGIEGVWVLAVSALALQTFRHLVDFSFAAQQTTQLAESATTPLERREDVPAADRPAGPPTARKGLGRLAALAVRASHAAEGGWLRWLKRMFVLPIGERFALISLTAALWDPRVTFWALLVWGGLAATYTITGRVARSLT